MNQRIGAMIGLFFLQPLFWVGVLVSWRTAHKRISHERKTLRVAVFKEKYEIRNYLLKGLGVGIFVSLIGSFIGLSLPIEVFFVYQVLAILSLVVGYQFIHPLFTLSLSTLLILGYSLFYAEKLPAMSLLNKTLFGASRRFPLDMSGSLLGIIALVTVGTGFHLMRTKKYRLSPLFSKTKRGKTLAGYAMNPFWLVPVALIVPAQLFTSVFPWWPVFTIGATSHTILFFPLIVGLHYKIQTQFPDVAAYKIGKELVGVGILGLLFAGGSLYVPVVGPIGLLVMIGSGLLVLYRHRLREDNWGFVYAPHEDGWKVVGVRPDTLAEKMDIEPGEIILECNQFTKEQTTDFYEALASNRVYCKLRIKRTDGQIRLAETAIYDDDSHDLGIIVIEDAPVLN